MIFPAANFRLYVVSECGSTNDELFALRDLPDFHGHALMARKQTAGHGRRGREWWSSEGNLALSIGFRVQKNLDQISLLPFFAGLALKDSVEPLLPSSADLRLKWPNDVYLDGKKLAGMVSLARQSNDGADIVLGVGVNLAAAPPGMDAVALAEFAPAPAPEVFAQNFLENLSKRMMIPDFKALQFAWENAARVAGEEFWVLGEADSVTGVELLPTGELQVKEKTGGLRRLSSETLSLRFTPPSP